MATLSGKWRVVGPIVPQPVTTRIKALRKQQVWLYQLGCDSASWGVTLPVGGGEVCVVENWKRWGANGGSFWITYISHALTDQRLGFVFGQGSLRNKFLPEVATFTWQNPPSMASASTMPPVLIMRSWTLIAWIVESGTTENLNIVTAMVNTSLWNAPPRSNAVRIRSFFSYVDMSRTP